MHKQFHVTFETRGTNNCCVPFWSERACQDFAHTFQWAERRTCGERLQKTQATQNKCVMLGKWTTNWYTAVDAQSKRLGAYVSVHTWHIHGIISTNDNQRNMEKVKGRSPHHDFSRSAGSLLPAETSPSALGPYGWRGQHTTLPEGKETRVKTVHTLIAQRPTGHQAQLWSSVKYLFPQIGVWRFQELLYFSGQVTAHFGRAHAAQGAQGQSLHILRAVVQITATTQDSLINNETHCAYKNSSI